MSLPNSAWSLQNPRAEGNRERIARFWISAPVDMLETLWGSAVGKITTQLVNELKDDSQLMPNEIQLRNEINERLSQGLHQPIATQLLLANFLFSPTNRLKIQNAEQSLPSWFVEVYKNIYENSSVNNIPSTAAISSNQDEDFTPSLTIFPDTLQELINNRIQLNRMLGLSNLYYIDPEDKEIFDELVEVRRAFANAISRCPENLLEDLWVNHLEDRYWSMVRCGIQNQTLSQEDEVVKQNAVSKLSPSMGGGFDQPGSINAFLIAMLYFEPGSMSVNDPNKNVPPWLMQNFKDIFMQSLNSAE